jgi:Ni/Co efflux regulator RcnB
MNESKEIAMKARSLGSLVLLSTLALGSAAALAEASQVEDPMQRQAERWGMGNPGDAYTAHQAQNQGLGGSPYPYGSPYYGAQYPQTSHYPQFIANDWQGRNLQPPPRGYRWVRVGNDYVLQPRSRR